MDLPVTPPLEPMLAKHIAPEKLWAAQGMQLEPKWDGFRCLIFRDGAEVELISRSGKPLTRYFPELVETARAGLPARVALDGELVVRAGTPGKQRLDWDSLGQRIHPAASRIERLSQETPAEFVAFDLLATADRSWLGEPTSARRAALVEVFAAVQHPSFHLTRCTTDPQQAQRWFSQFEGAGLDGVVAKDLAAPYLPGKRTMFKAKHARTADAVLIGYRVHKSGAGVGSLLLGMYTDDGALVPVGGIAAFPAKTRVELVEELEPLVQRDAEGRIEIGEKERSRFSSGKDTSFIPLRPERVVEVAFDQLEGWRFRHTVQFLRWRPDREPLSCRLEQVDRAPAYDLAEVLSVGPG